MIRFTSSVLTGAAEVSGYESQNSDDLEHVQGTRVKTHGCSVVRGVGVSTTARDLTVQDWVQTASGRPFWPLDPRIEDVRIEDIAHALAHLCRFNGHVREFYSVAQHSVLVSEYLAHDHPDLALLGLIHDAQEAYLCDIPSPLKRLSAFAAYPAAEQRLQVMICKAFGVRVPTEAEAKALALVDRRVLRTEQRDLMPAALPGEGMDDELPYDELIHPWSFRIARARFLHRFYETWWRKRCS